MNPYRQLKFECIHCGKCCCDPNTLVNTTYLDILRIKKGLDFTVEEMLEVLGFYIYKNEISTEELSKLVVPPIYTEEGLSFVALRKSNSGTCIFYNESKARCTIYSLRPDFCRTFPFFYYYPSGVNPKSNSDLEINYTTKALEYCKGISESSPPINMNSWLNLGGQVLQRLKRNNTYTKRWNRSIRNQTRKCSARNYLITIFTKGINDNGF